MLHWPNNSPVKKALHHPMANDRPLELIHLPGDRANQPPVLPADLQRKIDHYTAIASCALDGKASQRAIDFMGVLIQAALLTDIGITIKEAMEICSFTHKTFYNRMAELKPSMPIVRTQPGREIHFMADLEALDNLPTP